MINRKMKWRRFLVRTWLKCTEIIEPEKGCLANCQKAIWHVSFDAELIYKGADFICFFRNSDLRLLSLLR